jgi:hypothetical protein
MTNFNTYAHTVEQLDELESMIIEQSLDMQGRQGHGEYLGGNGVTQWHQTAAKDSSGKAGDSDDYIEHDERVELDTVVHEHQSSIEANGVYNIRDLAHWTLEKHTDEQGNVIKVQHAFNGDKYRERMTRRTQNAMGLTRGQKRMIRLRQLTPNNIKAKKAKRLERMRKLHG